MIKVIVRSAARTYKTKIVKQISPAVGGHARQIKNTPVRSIFYSRVKIWWSHGDSNPGPQRCQRCALIN